MSKKGYNLLKGIFILLSIILITSEAFAKPAFNADQAFEYLKKQCAFGPRPPSSPAHKQTSDYLISELKKYSKDVTPQKFEKTISGKKLELVNIIAVFGTKSNKSILLSAHWDTRPFADQDKIQSNRNKPIIGANDGASGVAVLLELARIFHDNPPPVKVIIVLFDGEDYGKNSSDMFLGSKYFAQNLPKNLNIDYGILLDMIGDKDLGIYKEGNSIIAAPEVVNKVWDLAKRLGLKQFQDKVKYDIMDDHIPLLQAGISCIDIIDFDYPYWHTVQDTVDKCSPNSLGVIGKLLTELIY